MNAHRFSVVIPVYNKEATLDRAVESALKQRDAETEILCVDDGSTDRSPALLDAYRNRIRVIRQANRGPSAARNQGIRAAQHEWIAFLDADDEWDQDYLAAVAAVRSRHPDVRFTLASYKVADSGQDRVVELSRLPLQWRPGPPPPATASGSRHLTVAIASSGIACSSMLLREIGMFDESLPRWEIADLVFRLVCVAGSAGIIERPLVTIHPDPASSQWLRQEGNILAHARLAAKQLRFASQVKRPEGPELRAAAVGLTLRSMRGLLRTGYRREAKELLDQLPQDTPSGPMNLARLQLFLPPVLLRLLHRKRAHEGRQ